MSELIEKAIIEGVKEAFFRGYTYVDASGYERTEHAPMSKLLYEVRQEVQKKLVKELVKSIDIKAMSEGLAEKIDKKALIAKAKKEIEAKLTKKLGKL